MKPVLLSPGGASLSLAVTSAGIVFYTDLGSLLCQNNNINIQTLYAVILKWAIRYEKLGWLDKDFSNWTLHMGIAEIMFSFSPIF